MYSPSAIESQAPAVFIDSWKCSSILRASGLCPRTTSSKTSSAASPKASITSSLNFLSWTPCSLMSLSSHSPFLALYSEYMSSWPFAQTASTMSWSVFERLSQNARLKPMLRTLPGSCIPG